MEKTQSSNDAVTSVLTTVPTTVSPPTIEEVFSDYYYSYLLLNEDAIWDLLSTNAKSKESKDSIYNKMYAVYGQIVPYDYEITNIDENGNKATIDVDIKCRIQGYKVTHSHEILFVSENGSWKIDEFSLLT
ncbi:MAG TPA: hypothetical protein PKV78_04960 [Methanoculleus thermophilus]|nr:hypothetical protein [Bacillota bacterium]HQD25876.1 hypothetical protein [Methanoculleus thermophilus]